MRTLIAATACLGAAAARADPPSSGAWANGAANPMFFRNGLTTPQRLLATVCAAAGKGGGQVAIRLPAGGLKQFSDPLQSGACLAQTLVLQPGEGLVVVNAPNSATGTFQISPY